MPKFAAWINYNMPGKLQKFAEVEQFKNCFAFYYSHIATGFTLKGKWRSQYFKNQYPLILELGCGKGEYSVGLASRHPQKNYIGVDIKGNRIWNGAKRALELQLGNVAFLRSRIDSIEHCFDVAEVDEIWLTFPDPQPQKPREKKRLTHIRFLERYRHFLKPGGLVHLKTDSTSLFEYTLRVIEENNFVLHWQTPDLYQTCPPERAELVTIKTYYEQLFTAKGEKIKYILFSLDGR